MRPRAFLVVLLLAAEGVLAPRAGATPPAAATLKEPRHTLDNLGVRLSAVRRRAAPHLVQIIREAAPGEGRGPSRFLGTGVLWGDGKILTCASVVGPAREVRVVTVAGDTLRAEVVGVDRRSNVALLTNPLRQPAIPVASQSLLFPGDLVFAVGLGAPGEADASVGTVVLPSGPSLGLSDVEMIEASAPLVPGFVGGALLDEAGRMVGLLSGRMAFDPAVAVLPSGTDLVSGYLRDGRFFTTDPAMSAIVLPVSHATQIAASLAELGYVPRGYLGLQVELTEATAPEPGRAPLQGVLIHQVVSGGPAARGGLIPGDVILEYAEARVKSPEDLSFLVSATVPGSLVPIDFLRRGSRLNTRVAIVQAPDLQWVPGMDETLSSPSMEAGLAPSVR